MRFKHTRHVTLSSKTVTVLLTVRVEHGRHIQLPERYAIFPTVMPKIQDRHGG